MTVSQSVITMDPPKPTKDDLEDKPWKYYGYKAFSEWAASDDDFFVLRRFKNLNTRVLLRMQDHIVQLERDLRKLDKEHSRVEAVDVNNGTFRYDTVDGRKQILGRVQEKLKEYNDFVSSYMTMCAHPRARHNEINNVKTWLHHEYNGAIDIHESQYVESTEDLVSIVHKAKTPLRRFLERLKLFRHSRLFRETRERTPTSPDYDPESTLYQSDTRMEKFCTIIITSVGLFMLITPLWWLIFVENKIKQLGIITGFIVLFMFLISSVTVAKPFETLAGTAGYSAVLLVFMQIGASNS